MNLRVVIEFCRFTLLLHIFRKDECIYFISTSHKLLAFIGYESACSLSSFRHKYPRPLGYKKGYFGVKIS